MPAHEGDLAALTDDQYWDGYWRGINLPSEVRRSPGSLYLNAILDEFDRYLPRAPGLRALEIGGAPGQYLAYLRRRLGYKVACLDYSSVGCDKTRENFRLLGISGDVYEGDLFDEDLPVPRHDVVYSLGLIEHFADLENVVAHHLRFLLPGGTLLLGAPNFLGVNGWFLRRLAPELLDVVNLRAMDLDGWRAFEAQLKLKPMFRGYVGGLEPCVFRARRPELRRRRLARGVSALDLVLHTRLHALRRLNSRKFSGYVMAVYRAP